MGKLALAAKVTHVPSMYLSEMPGKHQGCREAAIQGHREIGRRCRELDVDTMVVLDVHWLVNAGYHIKQRSLRGLLHQQRAAAFHQDMRYAYRGDPELAAASPNAPTRRAGTRAHEIGSLELEYGTLVPMRYMNGDDRFKVVSVAAWCAWHTLEDSRRFGAALRQAIEQSDSRVAVLASGSLSHRFNDNGSGEATMHEISREFFRQVDLRVVDLWRQGDWKTFCAMLPEYADLCVGEGGMHDTAMLLGLLGWDAYDQPAEIVTEYFASSGTGQLNAVFPVPA